jgi:predicted amidohydrolase
MKLRQKCLSITVACFWAFLAGPVSSLGSATGDATDRSTETETRRLMPAMKDIRVTVASMKSVLNDTSRNVGQVRRACEIAKKADARMVFLPECMLSGHGAHPKLMQNAEPVPEGPLSRTVIQMSKEYQLCICVGIAELSNQLVYNSYMVVDKGKYLGLQRKINLSGDEYRYFAAGDSIEVFDIGDVRFGVSICFDNNFPEIALIHSFHNVDLILAPHAERTGQWPAVLTPEFCGAQINRQQKKWEKMYVGQAYFHNVYILACNAVGSATDGLEGVVSNHAGTVMGVNPNGDIFLRTSATAIADEVVTVELKSAGRKLGHRPSQNRRMSVVKNLFDSYFRTLE